MTTVILKSSVDYVKYVFLIFYSWLMVYIFKVGRKMIGNKVLVTSSRYLPNIGGIENSILNLSEALILNGYEVDIVSSDVVESNKLDLPRREQYENGIRVYRYSYYFLGRESGLWNYLTGISTYRMLRSKNVYSFVVCRNHVTVILCRLVGFRKIAYVLPGVVKVQNDPMKSGIDHGQLKLAFRMAAFYYHQFLQWVAVRVADKNFVFSRVVERQLRRDVGYKGVVYRTKPGVDPDKFCIPDSREKNNAREKYGFSRQDVVIIGIGRFVEAKRFDYLIESLRFLPRKYKLLLVGSGSLKSKYENRIYNSGLSDRVTIVVGSNQPQKFYKLSDIYVLSSTHETLGQTLLEAQASGLPIVAFSSSAVGVETATDEVTDESTSILVEDVSSRGIADGVLRAARNLDGLYFDRNNIRDFAISRFSWEKMARDIDESYFE